MVCTGVDMSHFSLLRCPGILWTAAVMGCPAPGLGSDHFVIRRNSSRLALVRSIEIPDPASRRSGGLGVRHHSEIP